MFMLRLLMLTMLVSGMVACSDGAPNAAVNAQAVTPAPGPAPAPGTATQTPEQVAQAFMEAGNAGDKEAIFPLMTDAARESLQTGSGPQMNAGQFESFNVGEAVVTDDTADVPVDTVKDGVDQSMKLKMRQENNAWKVFGLAMVMGEDAEFTINFESIGGMLEGMVEAMGESLQSGFQSAMQDAFTGGSEDELAQKKARFDALTGVQPDAYFAMWRNTTDYTGKSAGVAVQELAASLGLVLHAGEHSDTLEQKVAVDVSGISRLEAIEKICNELDLYPVYPDVNQSMGVLAEAMVEALAAGMSELFEGDDSAIDLGTLTANGAADAEQTPANAITLAKGSRAWPVDFAGPFIVSVDDVEENVPHATGNVSVGVRAYGLDEGMLALLNDMGERTTFGRITDGQERSLVADENVRYFGGGVFEGNAYQDTTSIDLKNLVRDVETIDTVQGVQKLVLPTSVETGDFATLRKGLGKSFGDVRFVLTEIDEVTRFEVASSSIDLQTLMVNFWAYDENGNDLGILFQNLSAWEPSKAQATVQTERKPSRIVVKVITGQTLLEYPFELNNVQLAHFADMPEKLEPLSFAQHTAPIDLSFVDFADRDPDFPKVLLRAVNHSNKDAVSVHAEFCYLDRSGNTIKEFPHTVSGAFTADGYKALVTQAKEAEVETTAFFMPAETSKVEVKITEVEFIDGTVWEKSS